MLLSMTGHGGAHCQRGGVACAVEVRTINSRYFKLSLRGSEAYSYHALEPQIESLIRKYIRRGTVQVNLRVDRESSPDDYKLNETVLSSYRRQLESLYDQLHVADSIHLESLLTLPGVVQEKTGGELDAQSDWPLIQETLEQALNGLATMRVEEGRAMGEDLQANCRSIADELSAIQERAPLVVEAYQNRLRERLSTMLAEFDVEVEAAEVVREVGIFAERSDISEEVVRLRSHLDQFHSIMQAEESNGRKLEFLTQEMFRETNTIGSKANDAEIARHVIEIKAMIERMREMIQNVE